ncbi:SGNH/GDSL hydrolase family protein [Longitalea arenae]|uniref:SGNH/GDSL hydrolase family protein n=1 Tax=Longitalea arenae TaxID=2812558 RepID=UPI0019676968|nr:GDSL-type esterase/lipase family protein [Longitalea arenae]
MNTLMQRKYSLCFYLFLIALQAVTAQTDDYLQGIKAELQKKWPNNRTINLVFHGHSVPCGYFATPEVKTLDAYPYLVLQQLKQQYPYAVINVIVTCMGGENSAQGEKRLQRDVLTHKPDVLFIDYALNDRKQGLAASQQHMEKMIRQALKKNIKVILLTPSADQNVNLLQDGNELELFATQLKNLAKAYHIGLADSYKQFKQVVAEKKDLKAYMSQSNHPNSAGHALISAEIMKYFQ